MNSNNKISKLKSRNFLFTLNQIEKYDELLKIPSKRGTGALGSSGK